MPRAMTDARETPIVTVFRAPRTDWSRKVWSSQNVFEVTWMQNRAPAPAAGR